MDGRSSANRASGNGDVIRRGLAQVWETQGRKFVTFEVLGQSGPGSDRWIQFLDGELNVRWPLDEEPAVALARRGVGLPDGSFAVWHVAGSNAVFAVGDAPLDDVARFVESLFANVVAGEASAEITARIDDHR